MSAAHDEDRRQVVLGLAAPRAAWFAEVTRLAAGGSLGLEFVKCVSVAELRARLGSGRRWSAVLVDADAPGLDRDLIGAAHAAGAAVLVVDGRGQRDWAALGADGVLPPRLERAVLDDALRAVARPVRRTTPRQGEPAATTAAASHLGALVVVTGDPGAGASTVAMAVAQHAAATSPGAVVLADLCLDADQAVLHGVGDVVPGLPELVEAHRHGTPSPGSVAQLLYDIDERGYHLLLGLRRHRDWAALRPRAFEAAMGSLRATHTTVVCDVEADVEGERETGSLEVQDRNLLSRTAIATATTVVVVGTPSLKGLHGLVRATQGLLRFGVEPDRLAVVVNRAPRGPRGRRGPGRADGPRRARRPRAARAATGRAG